MSHNTLCWTDIPVWDLDRAIGFYSAILGEPVTKQDGHGFEFGLLPHAGENASGCLSVTDDNRPCEFGPLIYLSVNGRMKAAVAAIEPNGGKILQEPHQIGPYGYRALMIDSEGNRIALHSQSA